MKVLKEEGSRPIKAWVGTKMVEGLDSVGVISTPALDIEDTALSQLKNLARLPFIHANGLAVMPDVHAGIGSTVGSVIATVDAVIPAAVGVDIGCGMNAVRTSLKASDLPDDLTPIFHAIEAAVPLGAGGAHKERVSEEHPVFKDFFAGEWLTQVGDRLKLYEKASSQLGSLGSGNHFIEICLDENQDVWVMLHSGSRGIGNMIGSAYIEKAKKQMEKYFITLPDQNLAYLPQGTVDFHNYCDAVAWAQNYALMNRQVMMEAVLKAFGSFIKIPFKLTSEAVNCHHNYITRENHFGKNIWVTRKGAIRARDGDLGIIPGSMGQRSYIVRGKGNPESYCSCSHGAGRVMSRTEARRRFTVDDLEAQTSGVVCRKDEAVLDEIPGSYKDIDEVMALQTDLVEPIHVLKQILCVKGA